MMTVLLMKNHRIIVLSQVLLILLITFFARRYSFPVFAQTVVTVSPTVETDACHTSGDNCDDSAIWIHPTDTSQSLVIGNDKQAGIIVWDLNGHELQQLDSNKFMNNLDIRYNFPLTGSFLTGQSHTKVALLVAVNETDGSLNFYKVNPTARRLETIGSHTLQKAAPYGGCMYHSPSSGKYYFFVNWKSGEWRQVELTSNGSGITGTKVRGDYDAGGQTEGCVADDVHKNYYLGEEPVGVWKYGAEPGDGEGRYKVNDPGQLTPDIEGLSIYYRSDGGGYLIVSSQGDSNFVVYDRAQLKPGTNQNAFINKFKVGASGAIDASSSTDGLDVTNFPLGSAFPKGLLVNHDGSNSGASASNHKLTPFDRVAQALNLTTDTTWDPRTVGSGPNPSIPPPQVSPSPTSVPIVSPSPSANPSSGICNRSADANGDGGVNLSDFLVWVGNYAKLLTSQNQGEFTCNGKVNSLDFGKFARQFVRPTPLPTGAPSPPPASPTATGPPPSPGNVNFQPFGSITISTAEIDFNVNGAGNNIDTIAFWEAPNSQDSLMFVTSKADSTSLVEVWKYPFKTTGDQLNALEDSCISASTNGVWVDQELDLLFVTVRTTNKICVFDLPGLTLSHTFTTAATSGMSEPNLTTLTLSSGQKNLYISYDTKVYIHNAVTGSSIGQFTPTKGLETLFGDDKYQVLYIPDEASATGVYIYNSGGQGQGSFGSGAIFTTDEEGIWVYTCPSSGISDSGEGLIVVSNQSSPSQFVFFNRKTKEFLGKVIISGVDATDGISFIQQSSPLYPKGLFTAVDNDTSVVGVSWQTILSRTGLSCGV